MQDSIPFCLLFKKIPFNTAFIVLFLILFTPQGVSDHRYSGLSTKQSNLSHQSAVWEHFATEQQCSERLSWLSRATQRFPCLSFPSCPWRSGVDTEGLEKGKPESALFISIRYLHREHFVRPLHQYHSFRFPDFSKPNTPALSASPTALPRAPCPKDSTSRTAVF